MDFLSKLRRAQESTGSVVCVGLDPDPARLPTQLRGLPTDRAVTTFCRAIVDATAATACAYKPNLAFFEALGRPGLDVLADVIEHIPADRVIIADGKRGDIGNTAARYAESVFDQLGCDACTVNPYMGREAVEPFLTDASRAAFVLVRTSNRSASEVQELDVGGVPLWARIAALAANWDAVNPGQVGFVIGATDPVTLSKIRDVHPTVPLLIPGVGAQGGDAAAVMKASQPDVGPVLINSSRAILYAGDGLDYATKSAAAAKQLRDLLNDSRV